MRPTKMAALPLMLLAACSLGPHYQAPAPALPAAWDSGATGTGLWPDAAWWRGFGSTELDGLIAQALEGNHDLAQAIARIRQAEAGLAAARSPLWPSLSAGASASRSRSSSAAGAAGGAGRGDVAAGVKGNLSAAYQLDLFGKNAAAADAGQARLASSRFDREVVQLTLQAEAVVTYLQLLSLRDRIRLAGETLRIAEDVLAVVEARRQLGAGSDLETAQQRGTLAGQRAALLALRQSERQTLDALAVLVGRAPQGFAVAGHTLAELKRPPLSAGLPSGLLLRRPDIRKAESDLRAANRDTAAARAARLPGAELSLQRVVDGINLVDLFSASGVAYSLAASLTAPIFQGGRLKAGEDLAAARFDELDSAYHGAVISALRDVEDALAAADLGEQQDAFAREAYERAREAQRLVDAQFRAGTVDFLTVLDAQRTAFQANDAMVQAALGRLSAVVDLYQALGGGWDPAAAVSTAP